MKNTSPGGELSSRHRNWTIRAVLLAALFAVGSAGSGCGGDDDAGGPKSALTLAEAKQPLTDAPRQLVALREQANELLEEDLQSFEARLKDLEGTPVVINKWASWCGPCIFEFPQFQRAAIERGNEVAFIGLNSGDVPDAARTFLRDLPVPYPSYSDPDQELARAIGADQLPSTIFIDDRGEIVETKVGPYETTEELLADIDRLFG